MRKHLLACFVAIGIGVNAQIDLPYTEAFSSITTNNNLPTVTGGTWKRGSNGTTSNQPTYASNQSTYNRSGNGDTKFIAFNWTSSTRHYIVGPFSLTAGTTYRSSLMYKADGDTGFGPLAIKYGATNVESTHTNTITSTPAHIINVDYTSLSGDFTVEKDGDYYLSIACTANGNPWYLSVDDFSLKVKPDCDYPSNVVAYATTSTSANITWTAPTPTPANGYEIYYDTSSTTPTSTTTPKATNLTGNSTSLSGLTANTLYNVWLRSKCNETSKSEWSKIATFTTPCITSGIPYVLDFENATVPGLPNCTSVQNVGNGNNWATYNFTAPTFNFKAGNVLRYSYNGAAAANTWFYTQGITLTGGVAYVLTFRTGSSNVEYIEKMKVAYGTSPNSTAMTNTLANYTAINDASSSLKTIPFTPSTTGTYYFGFNAYSAADQAYLYLDDIKIDSPPTTEPDCTTITAPTADDTGVSPTPTTIKWTEVDKASSYKVYIGDASGDYNITTEDGVEVTSTSYSVNLSREKTYYVKVVPVNNIGPAKSCPEISFTTGIYCEGTGTIDGNTGLAITNVTISDLNNQSTRAEYTDFTSTVTPASLRRSTSYTISVTNGDTGYYTNDIAYAWIDYNKDGIFDNTTERTTITVNGSTSFASITIPATAPLGVTRMRVKYTNSGGNNYSTACGIATYGEVEDYAVEIKEYMAVNDLNKSNTSVYPNPFSDNVKISDINGVKSITVNDITGKQVKTLAPATELNLSELNSGVYIINLHMIDGTVKSFKSIKK